MSEPDPTTTIKRVKLYPTPGQSFRFAWKWLYTVTGPDGQTYTGEGLSWAIACAKRKADITGFLITWDRKRTHAARMARALGNPARL